MNSVDRVIFHKYVQEAAAKIEAAGGLPDHPSHPMGRIPVAHIYHVIQSIMGVPARDVPGDRLDHLKEIVDFCVQHREDQHITRQIKHKYQPVETITAASLEDFFA